MKLPRAKSENIVVQNLTDEVLIYDLTTDQAFCLNDTAAKVFNCCDGKTTFDELRRRHKFTDDVIYFALDELKANNLLAGAVENHFAGLSRREVIKRVGLASMIALPIVAGIAAPSAAEAASGNGGGNVPLNQPCTYNNETQSNCANGLRCTSPANRCAACVPAGDVFYVGTNDATVCNGRVERNRCCNAGNATVDGSSCECP